MLWLFAATDGRVHMVDGISDQGLKLGWGSDLTSVKNACGAGWQVLATSSGEETGDSVRAYEFPDRDPVAVSAAVDFPGNGVLLHCGQRRRATRQSRWREIERQEPMKRFDWRWLVVSSMMMSAALAAVAETRPQYGGVLHVAMRAAPTSLDPAEFDLAKPDPLKNVQPDSVRPTQSDHAHVRHAGGYR